MKDARYEIDGNTGCVTADYTAGHRVDLRVGTLERVKTAALTAGRWVASMLPPRLAIALLLGIAILLGGDVSVFAQTGAPDASTIVTTAQTTFYAVGALVAAAVGFFIIVKIVKWIRK